MSHDPVYSYMQVLDSINEMRESVAAVTGGSHQAETFSEGDLWTTPSDQWFEDCEFDPRPIED